MRSFLFASVLVFAVVCADVINVAVYQCSAGVGLSPWGINFDSRALNSEIPCADGLAANQATPPAASASGNTRWTLTIRSLGKRIVRQGVIVSFALDAGVAQLVGVCITDSDPAGSSTLQTTFPWIANNCGAVTTATSTGSPRFQVTTDDGNQPRQGFQIRNPPPYSSLEGTWTTVPVAAANFATQRPFVGAPTAVCNFFYTLNYGANNFAGGAPAAGAYPEQRGAAGQARPFQVAPIWYSVFSDSAGLAPYVGLQPIASGLPVMTAEVGAAATTGNFFYALPCEFTTSGNQRGGAVPIAQDPRSFTPVALNNIAANQLYGGLQAVLLSYATTVLGDPLGTERAVSAPGVGMYANFISGQGGQNIGSAGQSQLGFQLSCEPPSSRANEIKWITFTYWGRTTIPVADPASNGHQLLAYPANTWRDESRPNARLGQLTIRAICQNIATSTPTPPLYPKAPVPSPGMAPAPRTPGTPHTVSLLIKSCESQCQDGQFRRTLCSRVSAVCLEVGNTGCTCDVACSLDAKCTDPSATTAITSPQRRGLQQATIIFWLMTVTATTNIVQTAQYLAAQIRAGALFPVINAFSNLNIIWFAENGKQTAIPVVAPSASIPIATWPSAQASWSGSCTVRGTCRERPCASSCANGPIAKPTQYSTGEIYCSCVACQGTTTQTSYYFTSMACASSVDQLAADQCCWNVMQDVVCWLQSATGVDPLDVNLISSWPYYPPSIGTPIPSTARLDGPRSCPSGSSSRKGLLGLLGLLGLIPLCLCCLLLLLCLLRRKKREGDVHFATFDPCANPCPAPTCPTTCAIPAL